MLKRIKKYLDLKIKKLEIDLKILSKTYDELYKLDKLNLETGKKFNDLINKYAISKEELLSISETVAKFVTITRKTNIDKYLFVDDKLEVPRQIPN
jgi:hypothetical protein